MAEKQTFVPAADRPDLPSPSPDKRLGDLQVRDLEALLRHALHKNLKAEIVEHKIPKFEKLEKFEKYEGKWENLKAELGKWEHGERVIPELPGPGPVEDLRVLVDAMTQLQSTVAALSKQVEALRK